MISRILCELPPNCGGFGIKRHSGLLGYKAVILSRLLTFQFLFTRGYSSFRDIVFQNRKRIGLFDVGVNEMQYNEDVSRVQDECDPSIVVPLSHILQADGCVPYFNTCHLIKPTCLHEDYQGRLKHYIDIVSDILEANQAPADLKVWWLNNHTEGKGHWLQFNNLSQRHTRPSAAEWEANKNLQLLFMPIRETVDPVINEKMRRYECACNQIVDLMQHPLHCLGCKNQQQVFIARHDHTTRAMKEALHQFSKGENDIPFTTSNEPVFYNPNAAVGAPVQGRKRADLCIVSNPGLPHESRFVIDVAVCAPTAVSYHPSLEEPGDRFLDSFLATTRVSNIKISKYRNAICNQGATFVPIVISATGNPGVFFFTLFADILKIPWSALQAMIGKICMNLAKFNAQMILKFQQQFIRTFNTLDNETSLPQRRIYHLASYHQNGMCCWEA